MPGDHNPFLFMLFILMINYWKFSLAFLVIVLLGLGFIAGQTI